VHDIVGDMNHTLGLVVLGGGIGTRHLELDAVRGRKCGRGSHQTCVHYRTGHYRWCNQTAWTHGCGEVIRLMVQRRGPRVASAIIEDDQVILVTRDTKNRGGSEVTMYEVKGMKEGGRETGSGSSGGAGRWI
jgi:hypothetical protein